MEEEYNYIQSLYEADRQCLASLCYQINNRFIYLQDLTGEIPES